MYNAWKAEQKGEGKGKGKSEGKGHGNIWRGARNGGGVGGKGPTRA